MTNICLNKKNHITLALETSCDETSAAILCNGREVLANIISSQIPLHQKFGGVVPEIASRKHIEHVIPVIHEALTTANLTLEDVDSIGVTYGPGLVGALLVGVSVAKTLAFALDKPLIGVNHLEGHIFANFITNKELEPPLIALVVSGGHTSLIYLKDYETFTLLGQTKDDAAGEAYDKVARVLGLPYPGGPHVEALAKKGNSKAINFPRALLKEDNFNFSFSGLKSAVLNYVNSAKQRGEEINKEDIAASFQEAVVDILIQKTIAAAKQYGVKEIVLAGGVSANNYLKEKLKQSVEQHGFKLYYPEFILCTDNAAMIGCRAYYKYLAASYADLYLNAIPSLKLGSK